MILELDAGNSSIKYRVLALSDARVLSRGRLRGVSELAAWLEKEGRIYAASRASMVHSARALVLPLHETMEPFTAQKLCIAKVSEHLAGVRHAYVEPAQLGVDRWLAMGAAYHLVGGGCLDGNHCGHGGCERNASGWLYCSRRGAPDWQSDCGYRAAGRTCRDGIRSAEDNGGLCGCRNQPDAGRVCCAVERYCRSGNAERVQGCCNRWGCAAPVAPPAGSDTG